jgi:hypothetical protein
MNVLLSRWQFGVTITYHFLFVPLTIGLATLVAVMQVRFGAPLAMEGLLAFFLESTFIGLWLFGRNRLPPLVHTLSICLVSFVTIVSAFFILTANAWMQHPVGYRIVGHKAELTDFWAVLRNSTLWAEFSHTVLAAFVTGAMVVLGVPERRQLLAAHHREPVRPADLPDPDPHLLSLYLGSFWGLLAPVAIVGGLASLTVFLAHGATFLALKTAGPMADRARTVAATTSGLVSRPGCGSGSTGDWSGSCRPTCPAATG